MYSYTSMKMFMLGILIWISLLLYATYFHSRQTTSVALDYEHLCYIHTNICMRNKYRCIVFTYICSYKLSMWRALYVFVCVSHVAHTLRTARWVNCCYLLLFVVFIHNNLESVNICIANSYLLDEFVSIKTYLAANTGMQGRLGCAAVTRYRLMHLHCIY